MALLCHSDAHRDRLAGGIEHTQSRNHRHRGVALLLHHNLAATSLLRPSRCHCHAGRDSRGGGPVGLLEDSLARLGNLEIDRSHFLHLGRTCARAERCGENRCGLGRGLGHAHSKPTALAATAEPGLRDNLCLLHRKHDCILAQRHKRGACSALLQIRWLPLGDCHGIATLRSHLFFFFLW